MGRGRPRWPLPKCRGISALCCGDGCVWVDWCGHCAPDAGCVILCVGSAVCPLCAPTPDPVPDPGAGRSSACHAWTRRRHVSVCRLTSVCTVNIGVCETLSLSMCGRLRT